MDTLPPWVQPLPAAEVEYVLDVFRSACMKGAVTFKSGQATKITHRDLHPDISWYFKPDKTQQIYRLNVSKPAYLITFDQKPGRYFYTKVCTVAVRDIPLMPTWEKLLKVSFPTQLKRDMNTGSPRSTYIEFPIPEEGKKLHIAQVYGRFVAMQMSSMSEAETREWNSSRVIKKSPISKAEK